MSTISEQEAREAAARLFALENCTKADAWKFEHTTYESINNDERTVYMWAVQELARREAERAERPKPITAEWLRSIGFASHNGRRWCIDVSEGDQVEVAIHDDGFAATSVNGRYVGVSRAGLMTQAYHRGQLLDLLKALKGGAS